MTDHTPYTPPKVWTWDAENGGQFASINRPIAGATHDKDRPQGDHPLQLYSLATPNGVKVTVMLEELLAAGHKGAEYDAWLIDINKGDQFSSGFVGVNPNSKIPALFDRDTGLRVFESGAILLYLAEKFGAFLPKDIAGRTETLNWLFWLQGSAPYLGGGFGHFYAYAPEEFEYPINRFAMEPSASWMCWTGNWPITPISRVTAIRLRIWRLRHGTGGWSKAGLMAMPRPSLMRRRIKT